MWWRGLISKPGNYADQAIKILKDQYLKSNNVVVLTDEVISSSIQFLENLITNLTKIDTDIKFLLITRNQITFLESFYNHSMRSRVNAIIYPKYNYEISNRLKYEGNIDQWIDDLIKSYNRGDNNIISALNYDTVVSKINSSFNSNCVTVLPLEALSTNPQYFIKEIAALFKMDDSIVYNTMGKKQNVSGKRLNDYRFGTTIEKVFKLPVFSPFKRTGLSRNGINKFFVFILSSLNLDVNCRLSEKSKSKISGIFACSNLNLKAKIPFDLKKYGYPLTQ